MRRLLFIFLFTFVFSRHLHAQTTLPDACVTKLNNIRSAPAAQRDIAIAEALDIRRNATCFAELLKNSSPYIEFMKAFEAKRTDKQEGTTSGAGAATSLVSKGRTAKVISIAAEYGAVTESIEKQLVTVQGSLAGIPKALVRHSIADYCPDATESRVCARPSLLEALGRVSYGVSFDTNTNSTLTGTATGTQQGTAQPVTFTANRHQISVVSGRIILWNARDATSQEFQKKWKQTLEGVNKANASAEAKAAATTLTAAGGRLLDKFEGFLNSVRLTGASKAAYDRNYRRAFADLQSASDNQIEQRWGQHVLLELLPLFRDAAQQNGTLTDETQQFLQALGAFRFEEDDFISAVAQKPELVLEYTHNSPAGQKATSSIRIIFDKGFAKKWSVAANGAFTFYEAKPAAAIPDAHRLRDSQAGLQLQRDLGSLPALGSAAVSLSLYYQFQITPAILKVTPGTPLPGISFTGLPTNATDVFAQKGDLRVGQLKLMLGTGSSVRFPVSLSYSNRTELVSKPNWKGQIGVSYDFDSLFTK
jgi:hypothetical protein